MRSPREINHSMHRVKTTWYKQKNTYTCAKISNVHYKLMLGNLYSYTPNLLDLTVATGVTDHTVTDHTELHLTVQA